MVKAVHLCDRPYYEVYQEYVAACEAMEVPPRVLSCRTFCALRPKWVQRLKTNHRETCVCERCANMRFLMQALISVKQYLLIDGAADTADHSNVNVLVALPRQQQTTPGDQDSSLSGSDADEQSSYGSASVTNGDDDEQILVDDAEPANPSGQAAADGLQEEDEDAASYLDDPAYGHLLRQTMAQQNEDGTMILQTSFMRERMQDLLKQRARLTSQLRSLVQQQELQSMTHTQEIEQLLHTHSELERQSVSQAAPDLRRITCAYNAASDQLNICTSRCKSLLAEAEAAAHRGQLTQHLVSPCNAEQSKAQQAQLHLAQCEKTLNEQKARLDALTQQRRQRLAEDRNALAAIHAQQRQVYVDKRNALQAEILQIKTQLEACRSQLETMVQRQPGTNNLPGEEESYIHMPADMRLGSLLDKVTCGRLADTQFFRLSCAQGVCKDCPGVHKLQIIKPGHENHVVHLRQFVRPDTKKQPQPAVHPAPQQASSENGLKGTQLRWLKVPLHRLQEMLKTQLTTYIKHKHTAGRQHHCANAMKRHALETPNTMFMSMDWSERFTVLNSHEVMSQHWTQRQVGILVCCFAGCTELTNEDGTAQTRPFEATWYVLTDLKSQGAAETSAGMHMAIKNIITKFNIKKLDHIYMFSDGCASQFKCTEAFSKCRYLAMALDANITRCYYETAHGKGKHDSEGGHLKHWLDNKLRAFDPTIEKCQYPASAAELKALFDSKSNSPGSWATSSSATNKVAVELRGCSVLTEQDVTENLHEQESSDSQIVSNSTSGSRPMHRFFFDKAGINASWSGQACWCKNCLAGTLLKCDDVHNVDTPDIIPLLKGTIQQQMLLRLVKKHIPDKFKRELPTPAHILDWCTACDISLYKTNDDLTHHDVVQHMHSQGITCDVPITSLSESDLLQAFRPTDNYQFMVWQQASHQSRLQYLMQMGFTHAPVEPSRFSKDDLIKICAVKVRPVQVRLNDAELQWKLIKRLSDLDAAQAAFNIQPRFVYEGFEQVLRQTGQ